MVAGATRLAGALLALALIGSGCSGSNPDQDQSQDEPTTSSSPSSEPTVMPEPPATPQADACYRLSPAQAMAATTDVESGPCGRPHTARTVFVGPVDDLSAGHLLAIDSDRVQRSVATACPRRIAAHIGGTEEQQRLSILTTAWFTPTLAESDAGARWYRCDLVAAVGNGKLARLPADTDKVLGTPEGRDTFGICATAAPGSKSFTRVSCTATHAWGAIATYPLAGEAAPRRDQAEQAAETPCQDAALERAESSLDYEWGFDWPSRAEWQAGRRYGLCWAPTG